MKHFFRFLFFITLTTNAQDFETYYQKAVNDYEDGFYESPAINKAIELCLDISKYPDLLIYKATYLDYNNEKLLAIKYGRLALDLAKKEKDRFLALDFLAFVYSSSDDLKKSTQYYKEALVLAKKLNLSDRVEEIEFNILLRNFDEAEDKKYAIQKLIDFYLSLPETTPIEVKLSYMVIIVDLNQGYSMSEKFEALKENITKNFDKTTLDPFFLG
ncbi:hypothetical protein [Polaribacter sp. R77954]|uniref:hypothetical protein n=1 Tax=Polaribacter sp. R77954 TaxID=3093870 RepID=UPI0037CA1091